MENAKIANLYNLDETIAKRVFLTVHLSMGGTCRNK